MRTFSIPPVKDRELERKIRGQLTRRAMQYGSFGILEDLALRMSLIQERELPEARKPVLLVFAGDHGISARFPAFAEHTPPTYKKILACLHGAAPLNSFIRQSRIHLKMIDMGTDHHFEGMLTYWLHHGARLVNHKIGYGTRDFSEYPAMTTAACTQAMEKGRDLVKREARHGSNCIGFGEIGRGHELSCLALVMAALGISASGLGISGEAGNICSELEKYVRKHPKTHDPLTILTLYGGYEIAAQTGAFLKAAEERMTIVVDGLASATALLMASRFHENVTDYCVFSRRTREPGHALLIEHFKARPINSMEIETDAGSGMAFAMPAIYAALRLLRNVTDIDEASGA